MCWRAGGRGNAPCPRGLPAVAGHSGRGLTARTSAITACTWLMCFVAAQIIKSRSSGVTHRRGVWTSPDARRAAVVADGFFTTPTTQQDLHRMRPLSPRHTQTPCGRHAYRHRLASCAPSIIAAMALELSRIARMASPALTGSS